MMGPSSISANEIHLWRISHERMGAVLRVFEAMLSDDERRKARQYIFEKHQTSSVIGRGALRSVLGIYLGLRPEDVVFSYSPAGKPYVHASGSSKDLRFSVADSGDLTLIAVTAGHEVGADIERIRPLDDLEDLCKVTLSKEERADFARIAPSERLKAFFRYWTHKEAYVKATGEGFHVPPEAVEFRLDRRGALVLWRASGEKRDGERWFTAHLGMWDGYVGAVVAEGCDLELSYSHFPSACPGIVRPGDELLGFRHVPLSGPEGR